MAWQLILTDLAGQVHGEVTNANETKIALPHMRVPSVTGRIPLWHDLAPTLLETDCLLRAYRTDAHTGTKVLAYNGPIVSAEESADGTKQTVAFTSAGPFWRLTKRLIGKSKSGIAWGTPTPIDLGLIAHNILETVNADYYTGISVGSRLASIDGAAGPWHIKNAAEAIAELHAGLNSFEFVIAPTEPTTVAGGTQIGVMNIAPTIGATRPDAIFEYGTGRSNVGSYTRSISREGLLTHALISVQGWPDGTTQDLLSSIADNLATRGLFEELVNDAGVMDDGLRQSIADFHTLIRKHPRQTITFQPVTNARPSPLVDYNVGDTVRARAVVRGSVRFDALFRVWGVTFNVDANGNENVELELVMP